MATIYNTEKKTRLGVRMKMQILLLLLLLLLLLAGVPCIEACIGECSTRLQLPHPILLMLYKASLHKYTKLTLDRSSRQKKQTGTLCTLT